MVARLVLNHSTFVDGLKPVLQKLSNSELFCTIIPGRIHGTRTCHGKILELRVCALESQDSGSSVDRSYSSIRNPFMENSKMSVTEKCKKYLLGYRLSKNSRAEAYSSGRSVHRDGDDSSHRSSRSSSSVSDSGGNEKAKHRVLARSGSQIQEVFFVPSSLSSSTAFTDSCRAATFGLQLRELLRDVHCTVTVYPKAINENEDTEENRKKLQNLNNTRNLGGKSSCKRNENSNDDCSTTPSVDFQISKSRSTRWSRR